MWDCILYVKLKLLAKSMIWFYFRDYLNKLLLIETFWKSFWLWLSRIQNILKDIKEWKNSWKGVFLWWFCSNLWFGKSFKYNCSYKLLFTILKVYITQIQENSSMDKDYTKTWIKWSILRWIHWWEAWPKLATYYQIFFWKCL